MLITSKDVIKPLSKKKNKQVMVTLQWCGIGACLREEWSTIMKEILWGHLLPNMPLQITKWFFFMRKKGTPDTTALMSMQRVGEKQLYMLCVNEVPHNMWALSSFTFFGIMIQICVLRMTISVAVILIHVAICLLMQVNESWMRKYRFFKLSQSNFTKDANHTPEYERRSSTS